MAILEYPTSTHIASNRRVLVATPRPLGRSRRPAIREVLQRSSVLSAAPSAVSRRRTPSVPHIHVPACSAMRALATTVVATSDEGTTSPTTTARRVMVTLFTSFLLAILLSARGMLHAANGMADGPARTVTLAIGQRAVSLTSVVGLTWSWDHVQAALGRQEQPSVPPLLATLSTPAPTRPSSSVPPAHQSPPVRSPVLPAGAKQNTSGRQRKPQSHSPRSVFRHPTRVNPLRVLVTGDSLTEYLGPELVEEASSSGVVHGSSDTHYGTGLVRPDFVDWSLLARQQVAQYNPEVVVVLMGGNDDQNITMPNGTIVMAGSPQWTREYQRRAAVCMRLWTQGGTRHVFWLSIPPARDTGWAHVDSRINLALRGAAAEVPGASYLDILGPITNHGQYADFVSVNGQPTLVRTADGVHMTQTGSDIVSHEVLRVLARDWHFR